MKTVLVTGSEGNIGHYIIAAFRRRQPDWKILRVKNGSCEPHWDPVNSYYVGDLREPALLALIFQNHEVDYVIHAASTSYSHAGYKARPFSVLHDDCRITLNVLNYAKNVRKFVFLSSALIYEHANDRLLTEDISANIPAPTSSYGVAKYLGEQAVQQAGVERDTKYTIWRPFNVVSPLEPTDGDGRHVFIDFYRRIFKERVGEFQIFGSGEQVRCFIWVEEAADCIVTALERPASDNQIINLARNEPITLRGLQKLLIGLGKEVGVLPKTYDPIIQPRGNFAGVEMEVRIPSTRKLKTILGWESSTSVRECFKKFVDVKLQIEQDIIGSIS